MSNGEDLNRVNFGVAGIYVPCAIKGCTTVAKLDRNLQSDEFIVCVSCENAIFLTVLSKMAAVGKFPRETPREMALVLNSWRREIKGLQMPTRPSSIGS